MVELADIKKESTIPGLDLLPPNPIELITGNHQLERSM